MINVIFSILLFSKCFFVEECFENPRRIRLDNEQLFSNSQFTQSNKVGDPSQARLNKEGYFCDKEYCYSIVNLGLFSNFENFQHII